MSIRYEKKYKLFTKLFQRLGEKEKRGIPIIVEGKKDLSALRKLGINGQIICIKNSSKVFVDFLDEVYSDEVILFVDFDDSGVSLAQNISKYLEGRGVKVNNIFWKKFRSLVRKEVKDVEGLPSYLEKLKKRVDHS